MTGPVALIRVALMPLILILGIVSYSVRRPPIGGWLLFFFGQISISTLGYLLMVLSNYHLYLAPGRLGFQRWLALLVVRFAPLCTGIAPRSFWLNRPGTLSSTFGMC
jgi:hypothetical protein